jgi:hypothetical protein
MFRDSEKREWAPRVTCGVIADFERESGVKILDEVGKMLHKYQDVFTSGDRSKVGIGEIMEVIFSDLLGGTFDNLMLLAYVSVKDQAAENKVSFADFKNAIDGEALKKMIPDIKAEYESFFRNIAGDLITDPAPKK